MKDILITVISILLTVLIIVCMVKGMSVGQFRILSIREIKENSLKLDTDIEELNNLRNVVYKKKLDELGNLTKELTKAKQDYLDLASISTDAEIKDANLEQSYAMEFLWNKIGNYATREGIGLTWNVVSTGIGNKYTLNFTISGSYLGIINYIYALENDAELAFKIENFKIAGGGSVQSSNNNTSNQDNFGVTATFKVTNVGIKEETISSNSNREEIQKKESTIEENLTNKTQE